MEKFFFIDMAGLGPKNDFLTGEWKAIGMVLDFLCFGASVAIDHFSNCLFYR